MHLEGTKCRDQQPRSQPQPHDNELKAATACTDSHHLRLHPQVHLHHTHSHSPPPRPTPTPKNKSNIVMALKGFAFASRCKWRPGGPLGVDIYSRSHTSVNMTCHLSFSNDSSQRSSFGLSSLFVSCRRGHDCDNELSRIRQMTQEHCVSTSF